MAMTILSTEYPPRKPKLTIEADSVSELPTEGVAEGSTATVGGTEYSYDSNAGWIEPGQGGGGGGSSGGVLNVNITIDYDEEAQEETYSCDKSLAEIDAAYGSMPIFASSDGIGTWLLSTRQELSGGRTQYFGLMPSYDRHNNLVNLKACIIGFDSDGALTLVNADETPSM